MSEKKMDNREMSLIVDDQPWSPEVSHLYKKTPPPTYPGFFDQQAAREEVRTVLGSMPVFQGVVVRLNQILMRTSAAREKVERELRQ